MTLSTYAGLKAALATWSTRTDLTAQMDDFVFWAHEEIGRRLRCNLLLASADLTLTAETIAQPTGFLAFKRLYLDVSPRQVIQTVSAESAMDLSANYQPGTYPSAVSIEGTLLRFSPAATGTTTVAKALYYKAPVLMVADADTNVVLAAYPYLYLYGGLEALYSYLEDDNNSDRFGQKFGALIEDINSRDAKDTMSGPIQTRSYGGGVV